MILAYATPALSIVLPAHNEAENLPTLIAEIEAALESVAMSYEIIVVDDCSSDATATVLEELAASRPALHVHRFDRQSGQSAALSAGFDLAAGEIVVTLDSDLQNDPADIPRMLEALDGYDLAIGWRHTRKDTWEKKIISKVANFVRNRLTGECVKDTGCGLKAFRRHAVQKIHRFDGMHRFFPTLVKMHGMTVVEVPVNHRPRSRGKTHYNIFNRSIRPMADLLAVRWLQRRTLRYELQQEPALVAH